MAMRSDLALGVTLMHEPALNICKALILNGTNAAVPEDLAAFHLQHNR